MTDIFGIPRADYVPTAAPESAPRGLMDFLSYEAGRGRSEKLGNILEHYIPPEMRQQMGLLAMLNPVNEMGEAVASSRAAFNDPDNRGKHVVNALTNTTGAAAPLAAAKYGVPVAQAITDALLGIAPAMDNAADTARRFAADEYGGVNVDAIRARYPGAKVDVGGNADRGYTVDRIVVPPEARGQGEGTRIMSDILRGVDEDGAVVSLTPSGDFGGNKARLQDFYKRFGFIDNKGRNRDFEISDAMYRPAQPKPPEIQRGDEILDMLKSGRGDEVTDEMLDMGDPTLNARLNMYLYDNYDLPMDEASRMARAEAGGFDTEAYHATREDFTAFKPSWRGSNYFAAEPQRAVSGAIGGAQDFQQVSRDPVSVLKPVKLRGDEISTLRPSREAWDSIPETGFLHNLDDHAKKVGASAWYDVYDEIEIRPPEFNDAGDVVDWGAYEYRKKPFPNETYSANSKPWQASERTLPGYNDGSDVPSLERVSNRSGQKGFLVSDEAGASVVAGPDMSIRSRFARFDPRLAHLRNLSASAAGVGLLPYLMGEEE